MFNALEKPCGDNLSCRIFKSWYFVEKAVIKLLDKRHDLGIDLSKILDKAALIQCSAPGPAAGLPRPRLDLA